MSFTCKYARSNRSAAFSSSTLLLRTTSQMDLNLERSYMSEATNNSASTEAWSTWFLDEFSKLYFYKVVNDLVLNFSYLVPVLAA